MANRTQVAPTAGARTFFQLNATYLIAPGASSAALAADASCLSQSVTSGLQALIDGLDDPQGQMAADTKGTVGMLYGLMYQVEMMTSLVNAMAAEVRS